MEYTLNESCLTSDVEMISNYKQLTTKFQKACDQVVLLNNHIVDFQTRYDRAVANNQRSYRYVLRLRLMSIEGVRNCIYEYARFTGDKIEQMQETLINQGLMDPEYDVTENMDEN
jgi:hypothetical protein